MTYQLTVALKPDLSAERSKKIIEDIGAAVKEAGGTVEKVESAGIKPLSYPIEGLSQASFSRLFLHLSPAQVPGIQSELSRNDNLLRVLMIKGGESVI